MIPLSSRLESSEQPFQDMKNALEEHEFALGGSWDYIHGSFDRYWTKRIKYGSGSLLTL